MNCTTSLKFSNPTFNSFESVDKAISKPQTIFIHLNLSNFVDEKQNTTFASLSSQKISVLSNSISFDDKQAEKLHTLILKNSNLISLGLPLGLKTKHLLEILNKCKNLEEIICSSNLDELKLVIEHRPQLRKVTLIELIDSSLTVQHLITLANATNLKSLRILSLHSNIYSIDFKQFTISYPNLQKLKFGGQNIYHPDLRMTALLVNDKRIKLNLKEVISIMGKMPELQNLNVSDLFEFNNLDTLMTTLSSSYPTINSLSINRDLNIVINKFVEGLKSFPGIKKISIKTLSKNKIDLFSLTTNCPTLEEIKLCCHLVVSSSILSNNNIKKITLKEKSKITEEDLKNLLMQCNHLKEIKLPEQLLTPKTRQIIEEKQIIFSH